MNNKLKAFILLFSILFFVGCSGNYNGIPTDNPIKTETDSIVDKPKDNVVTLSPTVLQKKLITVNLAKDIKKSQAKTADIDTQLIFRADEEVSLLKKEQVLLLEPSEELPFGLAGKVVSNKTLPNGNTQLGVKYVPLTEVFEDLHIKLDPKTTTFGEPKFYPADGFVLKKSAKARPSNSKSGTYYRKRPAVIVKTNSLQRNSVEIGNASVKKDEVSFEPQMSFALEEIDIGQGKKKFVKVDACRDSGSRPCVEMAIPIKIKMSKIDLQKPQEITIRDGKLVRYQMGGKMQLDSSIGFAMSTPKNGKAFKFSVADAVRLATGGAGTGQSVQDKYSFTIPKVIDTAKGDKKGEVYGVPYDDDKILIGTVHINIKTVGAAIASGGSSIAVNMVKKGQRNVTTQPSILLTLFMTASGEIRAEESINYNFPTYDISAEANLDTKPIDINPFSGKKIINIPVDVTLDKSKNYMNAITSENLEMTVQGNAKIQSSFGIDWSLAVFNIVPLNTVTEAGLAMKLGGRLDYSSKDGLDGCSSGFKVGGGTRTFIEAQTILKTPEKKLGWSTLGLDSIGGGEYGFNHIWNLHNAENEDWDLNTVFFHVGKDTCHVPKMVATRINEKSTESGYDVLLDGSETQYQPMIQSIQWDYGDGTTSALFKTPLDIEKNLKTTYSYKQHGQYTAKLHVTYDDYGKFTPLTSEYPVSIEKPLADKVPTEKTPVESALISSVSPSQGGINQYKLLQFSGKNLPKQVVAKVANNKGTCQAATNVKPAGFNALCQFNALGQQTLYITDASNKKLGTVDFMVSLPANTSPIIKSIQQTGVAKPNARIRLVANASDKDSDKLTYTWAVRWNGKTGKSSASGKTLSLDIPDIAAGDTNSVTASVTVRDSRGAKAVKSQTVSFSKQVKHQLSFIGDDFTDGAVLPRASKKRLTWKVKNTSNVALKNVVFKSSTVADKLQVSSLSPAKIANWAAGETKTISVDVSVPANIAKGTHRQRWNMYHDNNKAIAYPSGAAAYIDFSFNTKDPEKLLGRLLLNSNQVTANTSVKGLLEAYSGNQPYRFTIDWGDGTGQKTYSDVSADSSGKALQAVTHSYTKNGNYTVKAVVEDVAGKTKTFTDYVNVADSNTTGWRVDVHDISTNEEKRGVAFTTKDFVQGTRSFSEYTTAWKPTVNKSSKEYFVKYRLPVPEKKLTLDRELKVYFTVKGSDIKAHDKEFNLRTANGYEYSASIRDVSHTEPGYYRLRNLNTAADQKKLVASMVDSGKDSQLMTYVLSAKPTGFRLAEDGGRVLTTVSAPLANDYVSEINVTFKGNGTLHTALLQYDVDNDGVLARTEILPLNTSSTKVNWDDLSKGVPVVLNATTTDTLQSLAPIVSGVTEKHAKVSIKVTDSAAKTHVVNLTADAQGKFALNPKGTQSPAPQISAGAYAVTVVAKDSYGMSSNPVTLTGVVGNLRINDNKAYAGIKKIFTFAGDNLATDLSVKTSGGKCDPVSNTTSKGFRVDCLFEKAGVGKKLDVVNSQGYVQASYDILVQKNPVNITAQVQNHLMGLYVGLKPAISGITQALASVKIKITDAVSQVWTYVTKADDQGNYVLSTSSTGAPTIASGNYTASVTATSNTDSSVFNTLSGVSGFVGTATLSPTVLYNGKSQELTVTSDVKIPHDAVVELEHASCYTPILTGETTLKVSCNVSAGKGIQNAYFSIKSGTSTLYRAPVSVSHYAPLKIMDFNLSGSNNSKVVKIKQPISKGGSTQLTFGVFPISGHQFSYSLVDTSGALSAKPTKTLGNDSALVVVSDPSKLKVGKYTITVEARSNLGAYGKKDYVVDVVSGGAVGAVTDTDKTENKVYTSAVSGTKVGITAQAIDSGDKVSYTLLDNAAGSFVIDSNTGVVTVSTTPSLGVVGQKSITIKASSADGTTSQASFVINVVKEPANSNKLTATGITTCGDYAYDAQGKLVSGHTHSNKEDCSKTTDSEGDPIPAGQDGHTQAGAKMSYTVLNKNGAECVKDNVTGLIWEQKANDASNIRHKYHKFTWYNPDAKTNGGKAGREGSNTCGGLLNNKCNTQAYIAKLNAENYCGYSDWRMPTRQELVSIVDYSRINPAINPLFTHTQSDGYWSASPYASDINWAQDVRFGNGIVFQSSKPYPRYLRAVRESR